MIKHSHIQQGGMILIATVSDDQTVIGSVTHPENTVGLNQAIFGHRLRHVTTLKCHTVPLSPKQTSRAELQTANVK